MRHLATAVVLLAALLSPAAAGASQPSTAAATEVLGSGPATSAADVAARPRKSRSGKPRKTRVRVSWSALTVPVTTPLQVAGTLKDKGSKKRVVLLQQRFGTGWKKVARTRSSREGDFVMSVPTHWQYSMATRVMVTADKRNKAGKSKAVTVDVTPSYVPAGSPETWAPLNPQYRLRWNPCETITYRVNAAQAPAGTEAVVHQAVALLSQATGLSFRHLGNTSAVYQGTVATGRWERDTDLVVSWARQSEVTVDFTSAHAWGGTSRSVPARDHRGRLYKVVKGGAVFNTDAGWTDTMKTLDVLLHELGHVVGLGHVADPSQIMSSGVYGPFMYGAGDFAGLRRVGYQPGCVKADRGSRALSLGAWALP